MAMNLFITVALVCSLAISAIAHGPHGPPPHGGLPGGGYGGPPPGGPPHGHGGPGGPRGPRGPPPNMYDMFESCEDTAESMRAKWKELEKTGEVGHRKCQEEARKVCMRNDMKKVHCALPEMPRQECLDEMMALVQGEVCDGESGGGSSDPTENEYSP